MPYVIHRTSNPPRLSLPGDDPWPLPILALGVFGVGLMLLALVGLTTKPLSPSDMGTEGRGHTSQAVAP